MSVLCDVLEWCVCGYMIYLLVRWHRTMNKANLALDELRELVGHEKTSSNDSAEWGVVSDGKQS